MKRWQVFQAGRYIETVYFTDDFETADEVRRALIKHDGYPSDIVVKQKDS